MEEIIIRVLQQNATAGEQQRLRAWRNADPANESRYQEISRIWSHAAPTDEGEYRGSPPSSFEIIAAAKRRRLAAGRNGARVTASRVWALRAAAAVVLVVTGIGLAELIEPGASPGAREVSTSASEMATVTLVDGSVVRLGPNSLVRFEDASPRTEVWLKGEAFFSIRRQGDESFTVRTDAGRVTVLGTRFGVQTSGEAMRVGVLEGRVAVSAGDVSRELVGGELGQVAEGNLTVRRARDMDELRPQLGNFLTFRSTPIWSVAEEISAHFGVPVRLDDPELGGRTVTASFQDATFAEVTSVVCRITQIVCTITPTGAALGERSVP